MGFHMNSFLCPLGKKPKPGSAAALLSSLEVSFRLLFWTEILLVFRIFNVFILVGRKN